MRIAVPNKGRLHDPAIELLDRAGLHIVDGGDRQLYADTVDPDITLLYARAADIPEYVSDGAADLGITGLDQVREAAPDNVADLLDLEFGQCRLVVAAPEDGAVTRIEDLDDRTVATEFPHLTHSFFSDHGIDPTVVEVSGATELTPHVDMADAIVDLTSSGATLRMNRLTEIAEILESSAHLFARDAVLEEDKVTEVTTAVRSVLAAEGKRYLMLNAPSDRLEDIKAVLPGLDGPTVMDIAGDDTVAVHAVVDEDEVFSTISELEAVGASGILVTEIERLVE